MVARHCPKMVWAEKSYSFGGMGYQARRAATKPPFLAPGFYKGWALLVKLAQGSLIAPCRW